MKLRVKPIYGMGWFDNKTNAAVNVPAPFDLEVEIIEGTAPFVSAFGQLNETGHPLSRLWLLLSQRRNPHDGDCNLFAFKERPAAPKEPLRDKPCLNGYVSVELVSE